jgi:hypothetical protein
MFQSVSECRQPGASGEIENAYSYVAYFIYLYTAHGIRNFIPHMILLAFVAPAPKPRACSAFRSYALGTFLWLVLRCRIESSLGLNSH